MIPCVVTQVFISACEEVFRDNTLIDKQPEHNRSSMMHKYDSKTHVVVICAINHSSFCCGENSVKAIFVCISCLVFSVYPDGER